MKAFEGSTSMVIDSLYSEKPEHYINHVVWEIVDEISEGLHRILDVGCGGGLTGLTLKQMGKASEVVGIEISEKAAKRAKDRIDEVIIGNVEHMEFPFSEDNFDFIILGDILEHLIDPWLFLDKIKRYQKKTGKIIASIPNVRCWRVLYPLLIRGGWRYEEHGVLDKSHLRFFTKETMISLFKNSGLIVHKINAMMGKNTIAGYSNKTKTALLDKMTLGIVRDFLTPGYLIVAEKEG